MITEASIASWLERNKGKLGKMFMTHFQAAFDSSHRKSEARTYIFLAQDAETEFRTTKNGVKFPLKDGTSVKDSCERFFEAKKAQVQDVTEILGKEIKGVKGQKAIDTIVAKKSGYVKAAFYRHDIGDIDIAWGDDSFGLCHIIKRRKERGIYTPKFLSVLGSVIENGEISVQDDDRWRIRYKGYTAIIAPEFRGTERNFLLTAFKKD